MDHIQTELIKPESSTILIETFSTEARPLRSKSHLLLQDQTQNGRTEK